MIPQTQRSIVTKGMKKMDGFVQEAGTEEDPMEKLCGCPLISLHDR